MSSPFKATYPTGGIPVENIDVPASAVLLAVYLGLGLVHAYFFFKLSKKTFIPQAMIMGFCISRVVTMALRIAWTTNITTKNIAIAASVFVNAGVLLIYIVNLMFVHRYILRLFPSIPTSRKHPFNRAAYLYMFSILPLLILVIVPGVELFLTSDLGTIERARTILRFAQCYLTVFASIPVISVVLVWIFYFAKSNKSSGLTGREVTIRAAIIFSVGSLLVWIQAVKLCQGFYTPTPETAIDPPWFLRRPILYAGFFLPELLCVIIYAVTSIHLRFSMPVRDGSEKEEHSTADENSTVNSGAHVIEKLDNA